MKHDAVINREELITGKDCIVIQKYISGIKGGRTLDVSEFEADVINAGHVIIKKQDGNYAPMPVKESAYDSLPESAEYVGVLRTSILKKNPQAAIMTNGEVNIEAVPYPMTEIAEAFAKACPFIAFVKDEEA